ncbi:MAG: DUF3604 domain-containing protein [Myxococcota bacterium]
MKLFTRSAIMAAAVLVCPSLTNAQGNERINYSEVREPCADYKPLKQPFFGNLHQHTGRSYDASLRIVRSTPDDAYKFARGLGAVTTPDQFGFQTRSTVIPRKLDFLAVTDHAEFFGEVGICQDISVFSGDPARNSLECALLNQYLYGPTSFPIPFFLRSSASAAFTIFSPMGPGSGLFSSVMPMCKRTRSGCQQAELRVWDEIIQAAHDNYDRTSACTFTTFVAYENTATPTFVNHHRNIIFRNEDVLERPITAIDIASRPNPVPTRQVVSPVLGTTPDPTILWRGIKEDCLDRPGNCDAVVIPHNTNLATPIAGVATLMADPPGDTLREQRRNARLMAEVQPLVEIYQDKGASECRFDPRFRNILRPAEAQTGLAPSDVRNPGEPDEFCSFELLDAVSLAGASGVNPGRTTANSPQAFDPRAYVRNVLKDGLSLERKLGVNPFKLGIGASQDDHTSRPGFTVEDASYNGHLGIDDAVPTRSINTIQNSSGGDWVVWAEENSRDSIFDGLKAKETYGTSGTRPIVRFFGGWNFGKNLCEKNFVRRGYQKGVPMGGDLPPRVGNKSPRFVAAAWKDDFIGTDLQRIQIVKGWSDRLGETHEAVYDVAVTDGNGGSVGRFCQDRGRGSEHLCAVWEDPDFDPEENAFYYVRVLENPVCRYSTEYCQLRFGINPLSDRCEKQKERIETQFPLLAGNVSQCCAGPGTTPEDVPFLETVIQERAWTSPIFYSP